MKKILLILITILSLFVFVGCLNFSSSSYIESIDVYINEELQEGSLKYYIDTKNEWKLFEGNIKEKLNVYSSYNISEGDSITIVFNFYNPKIEISVAKAVYSINLDSQTNETKHYTPEDKIGDYTKVIVEIELFDGSFNVIRIPSWLSDQGIKYQGKKHPDGNYTIWGVHFNIV